jgi:hypothetical protein
MQPDFSVYILWSVRRFYDKPDLLQVVKDARHVHSAFDRGPEVALCLAKVFVALPHDARGSSFGPESQTSLVLLPSLPLIKPFNERDKFTKTILKFLQPRKQYLKMSMDAAVRDAALHGACVYVCHRLALLEAFAGPLFPLSATPEFGPPVFAAWEKLPTAELPRPIVARAIDSLFAHLPFVSYTTAATLEKVATRFPKEAFAALTTRICDLRGLAGANIVGELLKHRREELAAAATYAC